MNNFDIEVISKIPVLFNKKKTYKGRITIEDFNENFYMSLDMWKVSEYRRQWKES
jgi:hypothetical protein